MYGSVLDEAGAPFAGAEVAWEVGDAEPLSTSGDDGRFKFPLDDNDRDARERPVPALFF